MDREPKDKEMTPTQKTADGPQQPPKPAKVFDDWASI